VVLFIKSAQNENEGRRNAVSQLAVAPQESIVRDGVEPTLIRYAKGFCVSIYSYRIILFFPVVFEFDNVFSVQSLHFVLTPDTLCFSQGILGIFISPSSSYHNQ